MHYKSIIRVNQYEFCTENCSPSSGTELLTLIRKFRRIFNWRHKQKIVVVTGNTLLRFILQEAPSNLTNVLLYEKYVVMLEPSQHVLIPATAEGLCKIYDSKP